MVMSIKKCLTNHMNPPRLDTSLSIHLFQNGDGSDILQ